MDFKFYLFFFIASIIVCILGWKMRKMGLVILASIPVLIFGALVLMTLLLVNGID